MGNLRGKTTKKKILLLCVSLPLAPKISSNILFVLELVSIDSPQQVTLK